MPILQKVFGADGTSIAGEAKAVSIGELGVTGTYTFLIPPEQCHVFSFKKENAYVIGSKDTFEDPAKAGLPKMYGITVAEIDGKPYIMRMRDSGNGEISEYVTERAVEYKLWLRNFSELPAVLRWGKKAHARDQTFGLRVQTTDAGFPRLLKEKKIGLAVRVRIDDLASATDTDTPGTRHTFESAKKYYRISFLPVTLLEAWVVDTTTQTSIVHWSAAPAAAK